MGYLNSGKLVEVVNVTLIWREAVVVSKRDYYRIRITLFKFLTY